MPRAKFIMAFLALATILPYHAFADEKNRRASGRAEETVRGLTDAQKEVLLKRNYCSNLNPRENHDCCLNSVRADLITCFAKSRIE